MPRPSGVSRFLRRLHHVMALFGMDTAQSMLVAQYGWHYVRTLLAYRAMPGQGTFTVRLSSLYPVLGDFATDAGIASGHYFHQDLWAARKVLARRPAVHVDVGSRIDGFVAHVLSSMPVTVVDIRPLHSTVTGLTFVREDALSLRSFPPNSVPSVSSLHAVEHFGLGRYGDPINPQAHILGMRSLERILAPNGHLYFSVPVGKERLEFNAHRVMSPDTVLEVFSNLALISFSAVDDQGTYLEDLDPRDFDSARFSCGLFEFTKR